jgi:hypothetical protein
VITSPIRPRHQQEPGIAAAGQLARQERLTALHSRSPPPRIYGFFQTRPHGSSAAPTAALEPPGDLRAAPLPHRCWVPPVRAPVQDFHLRSQRHARHTCTSPYGLGSATTGRDTTHHPCSGKINTDTNQCEVGPLQAVALGPSEAVALRQVPIRSRARRRAINLVRQPRRVRCLAVTPVPPRSRVGRRDCCAAMRPRRRRHGDRGNGAQTRG